MASAPASRSRSRKTATQSERIRQKLADDILLGVYPPGARLDETTLAAQFRLSRTPVREALRELVSAGLIDLRPHRGAYVSLPSDAAIAEMFEVMGELEASCARFAAQRISPSERVSLSKVHKQAADAVHANEIDAYRKLNFDFHDVIYRASHNAFLATTAQAVRQRIAPFRRAQFEVPNRLQKSHDEHGAIVEAILAGKSSEAADIIRHHVNVVGLATRHYVHELGPYPDGAQETKRSARDHQAGLSEGSDTFPA
ncbi:DNA-binding GntR family transcriptional regulator [Nitrobacteraceae bacterium AZCC 1564]